MVEMSFFGLKQIIGLEPLKCLHKVIPFLCFSFSGVTFNFSQGCLEIKNKCKQKTCHSVHVLLLMEGNPAPVDACYS